jgi:hypothetical protein
MLQTSEVSLGLWKTLLMEQQVKVSDLMIEVVAVIQDLFSMFTPE